MTSTKIIIEVSGGVVTNIIATNDISIHLVDHDNLNDFDADQSMDEIKNEITEAVHPDMICQSDEDFEKVIKDIIHEYQDARFIRG